MKFDRMGAGLLLAIRDHGPLSYSDLCRRVGAHGSLAVFLESDLRALRQAGLIEFAQRRTGGASDDRIEGDISISRLWSDIQAALGVSLVQLAELGSGESMIVRPFLGVPDRTREPRQGEKLLYAVMPFLPEMTPIYADHITKVAKQRGLRALRSDELQTIGIVMSEVWTSIVRADVVVVDCTGRNANVFYELGLAHTIGKPVVMLTQRAEDVPFDTRHIRFIKYEYTPRGMATFESRLGSALDSLLKKGALDSATTESLRDGPWGENPRPLQPALGARVNAVLGLDVSWVQRTRDPDEAVVIIGKQFITRGQYAKAPRPSSEDYLWLNNPDEYFSAEVTEADALGFCSWATEALGAAKLPGCHRAEVSLLAGGEGVWSEGLAEGSVSGVAVEGPPAQAPLRRRFRIKVRFVLEEGASGAD